MKLNKNEIKIKIKLKNEEKPSIRTKQSYSYLNSKMQPQYTARIYRVIMNNATRLYTCRRFIKFYKSIHYSSLRTIPELRINHPLYINSFLV